MIGKFAGFVVRIFQIVFAACVLGFSITAIRWQYRNSVPSTTAYVTFTGAFGLLAGLLGLMAVIVAALAGFFMLVIDALAAVLFLAGGIAYAMGLGGVDCGNSNASGTWFNKLINGGCKWNDNEQLWYCSFRTGSDLAHRCHIAEANMVFLFLGFLISMIAAVLSLLAMRSKTRTTTTSTSMSTLQTSR